MFSSKWGHLDILVLTIYDPVTFPVLFTAFCWYADSGVSSFWLTEHTWTMESVAGSARRTGKQVRWQISRTWTNMFDIEIETCRTVWPLSNIWHLEKLRREQVIFVSSIFFYNMLVSWFTVCIIEVQQLCKDLVQIPENHYFYWSIVVVKTFVPTFFLLHSFHTFTVFACISSLNTQVCKIRSSITMWF